ncbi:MAG: MFS transporter [Desulfarculus sp.]|nr:MAG: MFS transporter [Desulfarculus sp.]
MAGKNPARLGPPAAAPRALWNRNFIIYNLIAFLTFCNVSVFFAYFRHLTQEGLSAQEAGLVVGTFSLSVLVLRPILSPWLTPFNARPWMAVGAAGVLAALLLYNLRLGLPGLIALRLGHGVFYGLLGTAAMAGVTGEVPPDKSGRAFGIIGVITLLPFAVIPPLVAPLEDWLGGFAPLLSLAGLVMLFIFPLLLALRVPRLDRQARRAARPGRQELLGNLRDARAMGLLIFFLVLMTAFAALFFLVQPFALARGMALAGWFFTVSTGAEIAVRLVAGPLLDRSPKGRLLAAAALWLAACFALLALTQGAAVFLALGAAFGLGWGVAITMFFALLFDLTPPRLRAFNTNLANEAFQGGFLLGPLVGGLLVAGRHYEVLFWSCAGACLLAGFAAFLLGSRGPRKGALSS